MENMEEFQGIKSWKWLTTEEGYRESERDDKPAMEEKGDELFVLFCVLSSYK